MDHAAYREFKQTLIETAIEHDVKLLAYAVLHDLANNPDLARRYGINTLCWHFECVLGNEQDTGLVLVDRFNDEGNVIDAHMRDKMANGVDIPHRGQVQLERIVGFHYSADGQSHFSGLTDIVVGSLRWALNVHCRGEGELRGNAVNLLQVMSPMFWRAPNSERVPDIGFCLSPFNIRREAYYATYIGVQDFLREAEIQCSQTIRLTG